MLMLMVDLSFLTLFFFFNDTATTEIYTLPLRDALPISAALESQCAHRDPPARPHRADDQVGACASADLVVGRSEEHTSELQSPCNLVCRLLLEKKKLMLMAGLSFLTLSRWLTTDYRRCM